MEQTFGQEIAAKLLEHNIVATEEDANIVVGIIDSCDNKRTNCYANKIKKIKDECFLWINGSRLCNLPYDDCTRKLISSKIWNLTDSIMFILRDSDDQLEEDPPIEVENAGIQTMVRVSGKTFRCSCGCNVFTKKDNIYNCNACSEKYE